MIAIAFRLSPNRLNPFAHPEPSIFNPFPTINLQIPLPATPFFPHRCKTAGCALLGEPISFQTANSFASYYIHVTPAASCSYALFCATAPSYPSHFQSLPHSFYRNGGGTPLGLCRCPSRLPIRQASGSVAVHPSGRYSGSYPLPSAHYPLFFGNSFHSIPSTV
ncbi:MAG: hypothetical protein JWO71_2696 [Candidatus Acidoferrum typicum]|nr:hypothetical protein [Candidatus Acidoferrum typicum]